MFTQPTAIVPRVHEAPFAWRWSQQWRDVFFAHWRIDENQLRPHLPAGLELDRRDGSAWVSAVAFRLEHVRRRWLPAWRPVSNFLELNLRTYVRCDSEPGILFLRLHANSRLAVTMARCLTPLPYVFSRIDYREADGGLRFEAKDELFRAEFTPSGAIHEPAADSLDEWLLERYGGFVARRDRLYRIHVRHKRWPTQTVAADASGPALGRAWGLELGRTADCCHFSPGVQALLGRFV